MINTLSFNKPFRKRLPRKQPLTLEQIEQEQSKLRQLGS
ncbi:hypothetical protein PCC8801_1558 [Rippkaea orientalis PCC 8801]|uniref:Uncharacterized protein n=1 Tax=Rippkaea orientalis (strain PCC 8801 / RF-1) TaxID=41431 RepID=B7JUR7_RIPO1|nr:hypothetical protein PCC8801_1558 [Rippkaea orientalis PCC 8801]